MGNSVSQFDVFSQNSITRIQKAANCQENVQQSLISTRDYPCSRYFLQRSLLRPLIQSLLNLFFHCKQGLDNLSNRIAVEERRFVPPTVSGVSLLFKQLRGNKSDFFLNVS